MITECVRISEKKAGLIEKYALSHAFHKKRSTYTNAQRHKKRKWILNIDLKDFFPSINFGRVRGFFIKNRFFQLDPNIATIIAQIACWRNQLPQGSPCSPIISNLITQPMDIRLNQLAKKERCTYTRYADDLTFSTNLPEFPSRIAHQEVGEKHAWILADKLRYIVHRSGFQINSKKTRMMYSRSRQEVTGLTVNKQVNANADYIRYARAQANKLIMTGACYFSNHPKDQQKTGELDSARLKGKWAFAFYPKKFEQGSERVKVEHEKRFVRHYRNLLDFLDFWQNEKPLLLCEGETDNIYIKSALKAKGERWPKLWNKNSRTVKVNFKRYTKTTDIVQHLKGGTGDLKNFICNYSQRMKKFRQVPPLHPIIIVVDNDRGSKGKNGLFGAVKSAGGFSEKIDGTEGYYCVERNLYVVPVPMPDGMEHAAIEELFSESDRRRQIKKKELCLDDEVFNKDKHIGKSAFAKKVVAENWEEIDFEGFVPLLDQISQAIAHFDDKKTEKVAAC